MPQPLHVALDRSTQRGRGGSSLSVDAFLIETVGATTPALGATRRLMSHVRSEKRRPEVELPLDHTPATERPSAARLLSFDASLRRLGYLSLAVA
jgi:hypothetical protein